MTTNNSFPEGEWQTVGSKNGKREVGVNAGTNTCKNGGSAMQVAAATRENADDRGRSNVTGIDNTQIYRNAKLQC
jgi:hypothetical protein